MCFEINYLNSFGIFEYRVLQPQIFSSIRALTDVSKMYVNLGDNAMFWIRSCPRKFIHPLFLHRHFIWSNTATGWVCGFSQYMFEIGPAVFCSALDVSENCSNNAAYLGFPCHWWHTFDKSWASKGTLSVYASKNLWHVHTSSHGVPS